MMTTVKMISNSKELTSLVKTLSQEPLISVDTESNSLYAYREQVCLIQFSIPAQDFILDTLAVDDLSALAPVFSNEDQEKIFHAAEYDLLCLKRDFDFSFKNIFDTMLAARISGREVLGLGNLLESEFGVHAEKKYQRANWGKRPLTPEMLKYAAMDTHYLIPLREKLTAELKDGEFWHLAQEDFTRLCDVSDSLPVLQEADPWKIIGKEKISSRQMAILQELVEYREAKAKQYDLPLFKVLGNKTLIEIARNEVSSLRGLEDIPGMSAKQIQRHGKALLAAVERGKTASPPPRTRMPRPSISYIERMDKLKDWRKSQASKNNVASDVILPRSLMEKIGKENPQTTAQLEAILSDSPWRLKHFGDDLLTVISE